MDIDITNLETTQSNIILAMFCSAILTTFQPELKYSTPQFYENLTHALSLFNILGTIYLFIRMIGYFRGRWEAWWFIPKIVLETFMWILLVYFLGFEGGLLVKRHVVGEFGSFNRGDGERLMMQPF